MNGSEATHEFHSYFTHSYYIKHTFNGHKVGFKPHVVPTKQYVILDAVIVLLLEALVPLRNRDCTCALTLPT